MSEHKKHIISSLFIIYMLLLNYEGRCQGINISAGGSITTTSSASIEISNGGFINNGTYTNDTETLTFSGNSAQTLSGINTNIYNLLVTNTGGITTQFGLLTTNNITVAAGCSFYIDPNKTVTSNGTVLNNNGNAGLVLRSDATGTASLIHNTNTVPATVNRYITGSPEAWHFLSSPVAAQSISGSLIPAGTYGNGTGYDLYVWNEATNCWIYKLNTTTPVNWNTVHPGGNLTVGKGYLYSLQEANPTKQFTGNLNNGSQSISLTALSANAALAGFNLVGNPYPSSIDWQTGSGWNRTNLKTSGSGYDIWVWNHTANNYGVINSATGTGTNGVTRYLAPMQGFFVRAESTGNLEFDNSVRFHNGAGNWLKKGADYNENNIQITINSESGIGSDEVKLIFGSLKNEAGAAKLFSQVTTAPSLFLSYKGENLSIRYLTDTIENPSTQILFKPGQSGKYIIRGNVDRSRFATVVLEDTKLKVLHDLRTTSEYKFSATEGDNNNRFILHFKQVETTGRIILPAEIYTRNNQLIVDLSIVKGITELRVIDITGREQYKNKLQGESLHEIKLISKSQLLIVYLMNPTGILCKKIMWIYN